MASRTWPGRNVTVDVATTSSPVGRIATRGPGVHEHLGDARRGEHAQIHGAQRTPGGEADAADAADLPVLAP